MHLHRALAQVLQEEFKNKSKLFKMLGKQISNVQVYGDQTVRGEKTFTDNITLNVKGSTKIKGGLTLEAGAITLPTTIKMPTLNQLGYSILGTLTSGLSITANGSYTIATITLPSGVWLLNSQLVFVTTGVSAAFSEVKASISTTTALDSSNLTLTRSSATTAQNSFIAHHNVRIVTLTAASTTYYLVGSISFTSSGSPVFTYSTSYLKATRIA